MTQPFSVLVPWEAGWPCCARASRSSASTTRQAPSWRALPASPACTLTRWWRPSSPFRGHQRRLTCCWRCDACSAACDRCSAARAPASTRTSVCSWAPRRGGSAAGRPLLRPSWRRPSSASSPPRPPPTRHRLTNHQRPTVWRPGKFRLFLGALNFWPRKFYWVERGAIRETTLDIFNLQNSYQNYFNDQAYILCPVYIIQTF